MKNALFAPLIVISLLLAGLSPLYGQVSITDSDWLNLKGHVITLGIVDSPTTIDLGTTGGPQTWDFRDLATSDSIDINVVEPIDTPYASEFPTSNFAMEIEQDYEALYHYEYYQMESDRASYFGLVKLFPDTFYVQRLQPAAQEPLPLVMGTSWSHNHTFDEEETHIEERGRSEVDAYGTMIIPFGTFETLRVANYDTTTETAMDSSWSNTETMIWYRWLSKELPLLINVDSEEGETNPDFTTAQLIILVSDAQPHDGISDGDEVATMLPRAYRLEQNYPNPFNPSTTISFDISGSVDTSQPANLTVYDIRGRRVKELINSEQTPGTHAVHWNGRNDRGEAVPSGIYLYTLKAGEERYTRKMTILK